MKKIAKQSAAKILSITFILSGAFASFSSANPLARVKEILSDCSYSCSHECRRIVQSLKNHVDDADYACGGTGGGGRLPPLGDNVKIYNNDNCNGSLIATVNSRTDCTQFTSSSKQAWAIEMNGQCFDLQDMSVQKACYRFRSGTNSRSVKIYNNDNCNGSLIAVVDDYTNCQEFTSTSKKAWAIESGGVCSDIQDMTVTKACERFKSTGF